MVLTFAQRALARVAVLVPASAVAGCAGTPHPVAAPAASLTLPDVPLVAADGAATGARHLVEGAPLTVLIFFSPDCHCLGVHEPRLRALFEADHPRGVQFVMIDSEVGGSPERDAREAQARAYPFPILLDHGARLANALGAEYATFTAVVDSSGRIHYRGGIDSDKTHLHDGATPYLQQALDDLLDQREPRVAEGKTLGCALQKW